MKVKKKTNLGLGLPLSGLLPAGVACLARVVVYGCCPLGFDKLVSCLLLAGLRNLLLCLLSAEEVGVRLTPHWRRGWIA